MRSTRRPATQTTSQPSDPALKPSVGGLLLLFQHARSILNARLHPLQPPSKFLDNLGSVFVEAAETALAKGPDAFVKYLQDYLTSEYRDDELGGCPVAQTGSELALADAPVRQGVSDALERLIEMALTLTDGSDAAEAETIFTMSALVGAITVSRLINNAPLSEHIIDVVKRRVANQTAAPHKQARPVSKSRRTLARA